MGRPAPGAPVIPVSSTVVAGLTGLVWAAVALARSGPIPPLYPDSGVFLRAMEAGAATPPDAPVTGLVVPHHLLAADLIARGFALAARRRPGRIVVLCPDHYSRGRTVFSVCGRDLASCLGPVAADRAGVAVLLRDPAVSVSNLFSHEHALQALLPFMAHHFRGVPVLAVAIRAKAPPADWERLTALLEGLVGPGALVVQSTDLSHGLPLHDAVRHDQETLRVLASEEPRAVGRLVQPRHLDGRGAMFVQMRLQCRRFGARPLVVASRNSSEYVREPLTTVTTYALVVYGPAGLSIRHDPTFVFAGDTFTGRRMARLLSRDEQARQLIDRAVTLLRPATVVLNLEGVLLEHRFDSAGPLDLAMPGRSTLGLLSSLGVKAVVLANNHAGDFGARARSRTRLALERAGFTVVDDGQTRDLGPFHLTALTDLDNRHPERVALLDRDRIARLRRPAPGKPWFAFVHWGQEWAVRPGPREEKLADLLEARGVELVIGCHSHTAGTLWLGGRSARLYSLGNFLFDQTDPRASGQLLEVRFFPQGTYALRLRPIGNLYGDLLKRRAPR
ncbi:MAG: AmmeMemoRadiSam system protein B [Candidatus Riflebacteria bacterium]|nr:AmmeMemoRadiSam system protein B [Candidatus Riflebacteria bacterium]